MDKWKLVAIFALLFGLGGYGWYSSQPQAAVTPDPTPAAEPTPGPNLEGKPLPNWTIPASFWANSKTPIAPATLKGNVALIEFFRIGCSHCEEAAPFMEQTYEKYRSRGLKMVAIQSPSKSDPKENDWSAVQAKIKEWGITYPVAFDEGGHIFRETYGLQIFPSVIVVDKTGVVRYFKAGHTPATAQALTAYLDNALKP